MKIILFANTDWYLFNFRLPLAEYLRSVGWEVLFLSPPGPYGERLRSAGFRWEPLPMHRRSLNPAREFSVLKRIYQVYRRERPDVVHHFTIKSVVYGSIVARLVGISRRVNAVTGLGHVFTDAGLKARLLRPIVRALLWVALSGKSSRLILQNPDDVQAVTKWRLISPLRIHLIRGSGVDINKFVPSPRHHPDNYLVVLLATRLLWEKGVREFVSAAELLREGGLRAKFWLAGSPDPGNPASIDEQSIRAWQDKGTIVVKGHIDDMPSLLNKVDIVVLPSYREGAPRILLEAAACGLPIVTTDVPGCREVVEHDLNGLLVPPKNALALADAIRRLCDDSKLRDRMGKAGRDKVAAEFGQQRVFDETMVAYGSLV
jgi:glycosyltransferase involved in cell wall biosynthesis